MFVNLETAKQRYAICKSCDRFNKTLRTCKECNCFMPGKVTWGKKQCPLSKWLPASPDLDIKKHFQIEDSE